MLNKKQSEQTCPTATEKRTEKRDKINASVDFFIDADITKAKAVDISDSGVCFETERPISMHIRMETDGLVLEHVAELVWCKRKKDGGMTYGLEFNKNSHGFREIKL
ncbi:PilZ domain-containing protein [Desulfococcaceae bacterium HSG9]|nr:PilZ domain-containing protein [Desulfococcaceae bacterium HSG9]